MQKRYVVTGGAGFIGTNVVERLVADGHEVAVIDDLSAGVRERVSEAAAFHELDVLDTAALAEVLRNADAVFHLAAIPSVSYSIEHPQETFATNVEGTLSVLEAARACGARRVVFASSSGVYAESDGRATAESYTIEPKTPYALHKHMGEALMRQHAALYDLETVSLRFFNVYGPHFDPNGPYAAVIGRFLAQAKEGGPLTVTGDGEQTRDFVHVRDVSDALVRAAQAGTVGAGESINIGSGNAITINALAAMFGHDVEHVAPRTELRHSCADITAARRLLGWEPTVTLQDGIAELQSV